ncbi:hypothetical protein C8R43DRAFT_936300, partial [Mycena crocata]
MASTNHQLHPLEVDPETGEPFLRLAGHASIVITPPRLSDVPSIVLLMNDERVYSGLGSPPFPFLPEHAEKWLNRVKLGSDALLDELDVARNDVGLKIVEGCPVRSIREIQDDGTQVYIGDVGIHLARHVWELEGSGKLEQASTPLRDPNHPDIWSAAYYLAPSHHRQGIMSDALRTVTQEWGIPRMGVRRMAVTTFVGNEGSAGVFKKNGFRLRKSVDAAVEVRGEMMGVNVLDWTLEAAD